MIEFIDGASKMRFLYGIKNLSETFDKLREFKALLETQKHVRIKLFICDGHSTYTSHAFRQEFTMTGTLQKIRAPYTPQQNSNAERRIRTVFDVARTFMIQSGVPKSFWEDAVLHANFLRNHVYTKALPNITPYEVFWERKPNLKWLRP